MQKAFASAVADETPALRLLGIGMIVAGAQGRPSAPRSQQQEQRASCGVVRLPAEVAPS
jgi:hypothetical protein